MWVRIPLETYIFILNFSLPPRSEQVNGAVANEIKHVHSPEVIVVLDPRYDFSYKALHISTCSIALSYIRLQKTEYMKFSTRNERKGNLTRSGQKRRTSARPYAFVEEGFLGKQGF